MTSKRIGYIDAMRALTMILVVYSHIQSVGYDIDGMILKQSFNSLFVLFRMPLFFFISGWVLYKGSRIWNKQVIRSFLFNKFKVQIISTLVFFLLYLYSFNLNFYNAIGLFKAGYWFTYTLFFFFVFYAISIIIAKFFPYRYEDSVIIICTLFVIVVYYITILDTDSNHVRVYEVIGIPQWRYYVFFVFGTLVKKYYPSFISLTNNSYISTLIIVTFFFLFFFGSIIKLPHFDTVKYFLFGFFGIVIVLTIFRLSEAFFEGNSLISKSMKYIGRHTLDIYLLHFFFLPRNLAPLGNWFYECPNPTIEFFTTIIISLMVVAVCLIISKCIRISPFLAHYLFGQKNSV